MKAKSKLAQSEFVKIFAAQIPYFRWLVMIISCIATVICSWTDRWPEAGWHFIVAIVINPWWDRK